MKMEDKYKVLVADDSEACLLMMKELFTYPGVNVEIFYASNGLEAYEVANKVIPDLMLLDVVMPEINGIDLVKKFRKTELFKSTPIFILSATASLKSAFEAGADDFISKPFNQYELLIKVRSALNLMEKIRQLKDQKEQLERQKDELTTQNMLILEQKKDIIDDITYSKRIQTAILPSVEQIKAIVPDYFLLNMPRNIVSGDFYWVGEHQGRKVVAIADCTGHGISGAFMTMAGTVFLNEVFTTTEKLSAAEVLNELRNLVMQLLKQKGESGEASDGLDIALVMYDKAKQQIEFAGANNPVYIIRNNELQEIKGDRMPIGIHLNFQRSFVANTFDLQAGDRIYLFSDGYADQFGGPHDKKFRYKQFRELLVEVNQLPFQQQHDNLQKTFIEWKGTREQVDDIMVMGFTFC